MSSRAENGRKNAKNERGRPPIVAIGASAGGVRALQEFFGTIPDGTGAAFVVVVHLDPGHRSELASIIKARTRMPVVQVEDRRKLEADCVYVIPPDRRLQIIDHELSAVELEPSPISPTSSNMTRSPATRAACSRTSRRCARSRAGRWYEVRMRPYRTVEDKIDGVVITFVDVTERLNVEQALRESANQLKQQKRVVELSREPISIWNFDDGIIEWNRGCEELYGYAREEALGQPREQLLATRVVGSSFKEMKARLVVDGSWSGELRLSAKDGRALTVEARLDLEVVDGRRLVLESIRDITQRKILQARQQLLLGELTHRVKNTLAVVQSIADQTQRTSPSPGGIRQTLWRAPLRAGTRPWPAGAIGLAGSRSCSADAHADRTLYLGWRRSPVHRRSADFTSRASRNSVRTGIARTGHQCSQVWLADRAHRLSARDVVTEPAQWSAAH
jgi:PAS domain S-box-containing protein